MMSPKKFKTLFPALALPVILWSGTLKAEVPRVVADIAPVYSLVSMVMKGVGEPKLLVPQNVSPHHYAMRPSEAKALQEANLVVYVGHDMSPWMEPLFETVAASADALDLSEVDGVLALPYREGPVFGDDDNHEGHDEHEEEGHDEHEEEGHDEHEEVGHDDHEEEGHDDHEEEGHDDHEEEGHDEHEEEGHDDHEEEGHDDHEEEGHDDHEEEGHDEHEEEGHDDHEEEGHDEHEEEGHDEHEEEDHDDHAHHDHDGNDPHMWLDPENAKIWLDAIASELGHIDPENADRYSVNAKSAKQQITREMHHIEGHLAAVQNKGFLVFHDALQYFEKRFGIAAVGSISLGDASKPSASRLRELKHLFEEQAINCVLSEPQFSSKLVDSVFGGYKLHIGVVDPIGIDLKLGPALYPVLLENIALGIAECVNP